MPVPSIMPVRMLVRVIIIEASTIDIRPPPDKIAAISAMRHCRMPVVTVRSDSFEFHAPIKIGEAICIEAMVICAFSTSMEVLVKIHAEHLLTGKKTPTSQAYLTMIAIDENSKAVKVPPIIPITEEEKEHYRLAMERYQIRKSKKTI